MSKNYHLCINIAGALKNKDALYLFEDADGEIISQEKAKKFLLKEQAKGRKVLPVGECDNFCYQTGCKGHEN